MSAGIYRRNFLLGCCGTAPALFVPRLRALADRTAAAESAVQVDSEARYARIARMLDSWSTNLLQFPVRLQEIEKTLSPDFAGPSLESPDVQIVRPGPALEIRRIRWTGSGSSPRTAFIRDFEAYLRDYSQLLTARFEVTKLDALPDQLETRVRYELVGTGKEFYREQRTGFWDLTWDLALSGESRVRSWRALDEERSRSAGPWYADVCRPALGGNDSYAAQLTKGVDYWRTVLDSASGIDVYGHSGVSVGDIDNDGFDDLYICQPAGLPNRLYRNRGNGTFEDITEISGAGILENTACALFADFSNSGRQDLVVVRAGGPLLLVNEGHGKFRPNSDAFRFRNAPQGTFTGAAAADYDRDGWLDIYFCLYSYYQGAGQYKYPVPYYAAENGPPNFLMSNDRDGSFRDVTAESGLNQNNTRYSFCCAWGDSNGDGWPDLYVANDFGRKNLYRNNGDGTFTDIAAEMRVEDIGAGMSVCWFDYDNKGRDDIYVGDMWTAAGERISSEQEFQRDAPEQIRTLYRKHSMGNSLFKNQRDGLFEDATASAHVSMGRWSWSSDAFDFDHDGFPDLYIANGMLSGPIREDLNSLFWREVVAKSPDQAKTSADYEHGWDTVNDLIRSDHSWSGYERNVFYANNRDGTFSDISGAIGLDFIEDGRAFALSDFDRDGRLEIFLKNRNAPQLRVLKNIRSDLPPSISFRLRGTRSNRDAIGARITIETEAGRQTRALQAGSGFLSQHSKEVLFGLGTVQGPVKAFIRWPSGVVQQFDNLPVNHRIWIEENVVAVRAEPFRPTASAFSLPEPQTSELLPALIECWLLDPVPAPDFLLPNELRAAPKLSDLRGKPVLLNFSKDNSAGQLRNTEVPVVTIVDTAKDVKGVYSLLYRYLFDRHRELTCPMSFLIDKNGDIVKIYQGSINPDRIREDIRQIPVSASERLAKALPFRGAADTYEFGRNYLSLGSIFFRHEYHAQAEVFCRLALRDNPSSAEAEYGLGSALLAQKKTSEARECFERAVKLTANYPATLPNAWNNLGLISGRAGLNDEAIGYFEKALQLDPDNVIALENLGSAYRGEKRWQEARKTLERAATLDPNSAEANYSLAMVFAQTGQTDQAYQYLQKALSIRPTYPEALNNLGVLYLRTQRPSQAVATFEKCIRVAPDFDQSYVNLARVYIIEEQPAKARAVILELLKQHPESMQGQKMLQSLH